MAPRCEFSGDYFGVWLPVCTEGHADLFTGQQRAGDFHRQQKSPPTENIASALSTWAMATMRRSGAKVVSSQPLVAFWIAQWRRRSA